MSCVGFFTPEQLARVRAAADDPRPVSAFTAPEASASKRRRVAQMARSADPLVRSAAAASPLASEEVLDLLADDSDAGVRSAVARNPVTPPGVLLRLADDPVDGVRGWVAANPSAPAEAMDSLGADESALVRDVCRWAARWTGPADPRRAHW